MPLKNRLSHADTSCLPPCCTGCNHETTQTCLPFLLWLSTIIRRLGAMLLLVLKCCSPIAFSTLSLLGTSRLLDGVSVLHFPPPLLPPPLPFHQSTQPWKSLPLTSCHLLSKPSQDSSDLDFVQISAETLRSFPCS